MDTLPLDVFDTFLNVKIFDMEVDSMALKEADVECYWISNIIL